MLWLHHQPAVDLWGVLLPPPAPSGSLHARSGHLTGQDPSPHQQLQGDADHRLHDHSRHAGVGVITFILPTYFVINEAIFSFGIMLATTILLGLLFNMHGSDCSSRPAGILILSKRKSTLSDCTSYVLISITKASKLSLVANIYTTVGS